MSDFRPRLKGNKKKAFLNLTKKENRILIVGDPHEPFCLDGYLKFCKETYKNYNCNKIIIIGDIIDNHYSSFHEVSDGAKGGKFELEDAIDKIAKWYKAFPDADVTLGNHDRIIVRKAQTSNIPSKWIKEFKDVRVINTLQLMGKIGTDHYFSIIKEFDAWPKLSNEDMRVIKDSIPQIEHIIFVFIENEYISNDSYTESTKDSEGNYNTVFKTTYSLSAEFQIYDLSREQMVWNNIMYNEAVKTQERAEDSSIGVVVGDIMSGVFVEIDREDVLEEIYEKFAEDLIKLEN